MELYVLVLMVELVTLGKVESGTAHAAGKKGSVKCYQCGGPDFTCTQNATEKYYSEVEVACGHACVQVTFENSGEKIVRRGCASETTFKNKDCCDGKPQPCHCVVCARNLCNSNDRDIVPGRSVREDKIEDDEDDHFSFPCEHSGQPTWIPVPAVIIILQNGLIFFAN